MIHLLELRGTNIFDYQLPSGSIAERLDVFTGDFPDALLSEPLLPIDQLVLERSKETRRDGVVPTAPAPTPQITPPETSNDRATKTENRNGEGNGLITVG